MLSSRTFSPSDRLPPPSTPTAELRRGAAGVRRRQGGHQARARGREGGAQPHRLLPHHRHGDAERNDPLERAPAGALRQERAPGAGGDRRRATQTIKRSFRGRSAPTFR